MSRILKWTLAAVITLQAGAARGAEPKGSATLRGTLRERGTRAPLAMLTVFLIETGEEETTDEQGRFVFRRLAAGSYRLVVAAPEYERIETTLTLRRGEEQSLTLYLEPRRHEGADLEVTVRGRRVEAETSRAALRTEDATVVPGAGGDPIKAVESLPGVAQGAVSSTGVPVRGSSPEDTRILLDGHAIPMLFHLDSVRSVYSSALLSEINLLTGGFGPMYGNATGGVVVLETRPPRRDRWGGYVDLSLIDASALAEGPLRPDMGVAVAFRRSIVDLFLPLIMEDSGDFAFSEYPTYYDYQAKWRWDVSERHSLSVDVYGAIDSLGIRVGTVSDSDPLQTGLDLSQRFHGVFAHYRYRGSRLESDLSPGYSYFYQRAVMGEGRGVEGTLHLMTVREDLRLSLSRWLDLRLGASLEPMVGSLSSNYFRPPKEGDPTWSATNQEPVLVDAAVSDLQVGAYLQAEARLGWLTLSPGLRFDYDVDLDAWALGPQAAVRWQVAETVALKTAAGLYHRLPDGDERTQGFGNGGLTYERATHVVAGAEWDPSPVFHSELQGYYKVMDCLVARDRDPSSGRTYDNGGLGQAFGGEVLLRATLGRTLFAWVSYALSRSERSDGVGTTLRPHDLDQTHNLVVLGSWQFHRSWRLGLRFQYVSGGPFTPVSVGAFRGDTGTYLPLYSDQLKNTARRPPFHRLDLRLDREWRFQTWILRAYLEVENVYYHANPTGTGYNYDFSEHAHYRGLPILPSVGIKGEL